MFSGELGAGDYFGTVRMVFGLGALGAGVYISTVIGRYFFIFIDSSRVYVLNIEGCPSCPKPVLDR